MAAARQVPADLHEVVVREHEHRPERDAVGAGPQRRIAVLERSGSAFEHDRNPYKALGEQAFRGAAEQLGMRLRMRLE